MALKLRRSQLSLGLLSLVHLAVGCGSLPGQLDVGAAAQFSSLQLDYIIVGGGPAGLALARRLSENSTVSVGLIEAGRLHLNDPLVDVPGLAGQVNGNPDYEWGYKTVPQQNAGGRVLAAPLGKMIGGSSGINLMGWDRGASQEYDAWSQFFPSGGWSWAGILPYLKCVENANVKAVDPFPGVVSGGSTDPAFNGFTGPINSTLQMVYMDDVNPYVRAWNTLNVSTITNAYTGNKNGIYNIRVAIDDNTGTRSYGATGYYCPIAARTNYHVITFAQATKVLFGQTPDSSGLYTATGVSFNVGGQLFNVTARKEVILSAGTIKTPQLLELSGIGNSNLLTKLGIKTLVNLPGVGENLQDHAFTSSQFGLSGSLSTFDKLRNDPAFAEQQEDIYNQNGTGWMAATDSAVAFIPLQSFIPSGTITDLLAQLKTALKNNTALTQLQKVQYDIQLDWLSSGSVPQTEFILFSKGFVTQPGGSYISVLSGIQHPFSRGSIHINSTNPLVGPQIDPNYLGNDFDLEMLGYVTQTVNTISQTPPLSQYITGQQLPPSVLSGLDNYKAYAIGSLGSGSHLIGTAAMAQRSIGGVVDTTLKVYGTRNLRVADASIMPLHISAHLQATAFAIGEKAADIIRGYSACTDS